MKRLALLAALLAVCGAARAQMQVAPHPQFIVPNGSQGGCWAIFFAGPNYQAPEAQLVGRTYVQTFGHALTPPPPALAAVGGREFLAKAQSLIVGPHAKVQGYAAITFRSPSLVIGPDRRIADLGQVRFHRRVRSLKVLCVP